MGRRKINVYTKLNNQEESNEMFAIISNDVIKYIDLENNKMIIDMLNNIMIRENSDYLYTIDFNKNNIDIYMKKLRKHLDKDIKTLIIEKTRKHYLVRYLLSDDNVYNEYYVNF